MKKYEEVVDPTSGTGDAMVFLLRPEKLHYLIRPPAVHQWNYW
tara:strand:- start:606 stop:734 length:129 start_codon:yes stop_codon:yes gene_type:complete